MNVAASPRLRSRKAVNAVFVAACGVATLIAVIALLAILGSLLIKGLGGLNLAVFTLSTPAPGSEGGLANAIVGSLMMLGMGMLFALVVGVLTGTWLAEYGGNTHYAQLIRFVNAVLLSAPSILIGLFVYQMLVAHLFVVGPPHGFSGYAGSIALALIAVPVITRTTEDVLRLQPGALRESGIALGAPVSKTIRSILWRAAGAGMVTGGLLAFARISGETAPLLFTSLSNQFFSLDMGKPLANLPVVIYNYALSAYDDWRRLAWAGAVIISLAVLATNIVARYVIREQRRS
jgi:phosphate transport system permease protein